MKVFWSWQSDRIPRNHHYFVRDALTRACDLIATEADIDESERPEVDHDTKDVPGSPGIASTIAAKIEESAAFVADMTPIATTDPAQLRPDLASGDRPESKHIQNPNVMSELGYAERALGLDRIILVANTAHYPGPSALPFDWRHRRGPLVFFLPDGATKGAREAELDAFAKRLREPLRLIFSKRSAPQEPLEQPVASLEDPAIWSGSANGVKFSEGATSGGLKKAVLEAGPRLYAKVHPTNWSKVSAATLSEIATREQLYLWIRGQNGTFGRSGEGAFSAQQLETMDYGTYRVGSMSQWFQASGTVWAVDTTSFGGNEGGRNFFCQLPFRHLAVFLKTAIQVIGRVGGRGPFTIELGCTGLDDVAWPGTYEFAKMPALKSAVHVTRTKSSWKNEERNRLLWDFWNELREAFGLDPAQTLVDFQRDAAVVLETDDGSQE